MVPYDTIYFVLEARSMPSGLAIPLIAPCTSGIAPHGGTLAREQWTAPVASVLSVEDQTRVRWNGRSSQIIPSCSITPATAEDNTALWLAGSRWPYHRLPVEITDRPERTAVAARPLGMANLTSEADHVHMQWVAPARWNGLSQLHVRGIRAGARADEA
jgi:hypothetical protein